MLIKDKQNTFIKDKQSTSQKLYLLCVQAVQFSLEAYLDFKMFFLHSAALLC